MEKINNYHRCANPTSLPAKKIVKLFEDAAARKRLAELLVGEPDVRLAIINAVLRNIVAKTVSRSYEGVEEKLMGLGEVVRPEDLVVRLEKRLAVLEAF